MRKQICTGLIGGFLVLGTAGLSQATGLILTGVIDGPLAGGTPKAVELFARSDINDLSIYSLGFANNGGGSDGREFTFTAIPVAAGDFLYVASETAEFTNFFEFPPDYNTSAANINGDDAIELFRNGTVVNVFGNIAVDGTGQSWEYLDGWAYRNNATGTIDTSIFTMSEWHFSGSNALDGKTANVTADDPFPAGSFSPGLPLQPVPTPEPATILLLGSGITGLLGNHLRLARRKKFLS